MNGNTPKLIERTETDGYLSFGQTALDFAVRERGLSFTEVLLEDPQRIIFQWKKTRESAKRFNFAGLGFSAIAVAVGVFTGGTPLLVSGILGIALNGFFIKHHSDANHLLDIERDLLNNSPHLIDLFESIEQNRRIRKGILISLYNYLVGCAYDDPLIATNPNLIHQYLSQQLESISRFSEIERIPVKIGDLLPEATGENLVDNLGDKSINNLVNLPNTVIEEPECPNLLRIEPQEELDLQSKLEPQKPEIEPYDIVESLVENLQSCLIVGQPGAGKGFLVANAIRKLKQEKPNIEVWVLDPKADPNEQDYFNSADYLCQKSIGNFSSEEEVRETLEEYNHFLYRYSQSQNPSVLVIDENLALLSKAPKWYKSLIGSCHAICSMGRSRQQFVWLISQSPNASDFNMSGGARGVYRRIYLASATNKSCISKRCEFYEGFPDNDLFDLTGRVVFDSLINDWKPLKQYSLEG